MYINTSTFCFDPGLKHIKTDARLSVQINDEIIPKMHNKMNRHIKKAAVTRQNAVITTTVDRDAGVIRCDGQVAYIVKIDYLKEDPAFANVYIYNEHAIVIDTDAGRARVYALPYENSPVLYECSYNKKKDEDPFDKKAIKHCIRFIDEDVWLTYMIRSLAEIEREKDDIAAEAAYV